MTEQVIGPAIEVHRNTGPGLLESTYEQCLCVELWHAGVAFSMMTDQPEAQQACAEQANGSRFGDGQADSGKRGKGDAGEAVVVLDYRES